MIPSMNNIHHMLPYWDLLEERIYWSGEEQLQKEGALVISFFIRNWFCSAILFPVIVKHWSGIVMINLRNMQ